ncbi:hypothetical protein DHEL01_v209510 [Diaporthe helianthi]|uniref:Uncharacterized protein n=1 Tax=Diaporthe helianthi TaxID=158607 RepID=A0A2P5HPB6_DIAHE|nr:hypothetical protein DHEL01_v209510 [Diaporthe helianthi]
MTDLKTASIWASRVGLLFSVIAHLNGNYGPSEDTYAAALITSLILIATFVPERYYSRTKYYASEVARNVAVALFLFFIAYASATAAVLFHDKALPGLANLVRGSQLQAAVIIFVILGFAILPYIPSNITAFFDAKIPRSVARVSARDGDVVADKPTKAVADKPTFVADLPPVVPRPAQVSSPSVA